MASPGYLTARGVPRHPTELEHHALIVDPSPSMTGALVFEGADGRHVVRVNGPVRTERALVQRVCALAGMGIAEIPAYLIADDLASGALLEVLPTHRLPPLEWWPVFPPHGTLTARVRAFIDHIVVGLA